MSKAAQDRWKRFVGPAMILLAAGVAMMPQILHGNSCGHDFDFHLVSWIDALNSWRHGIVYPHWTPSANYGAGEPRFVFYPPLTWMLGAALGFALPWALVPVALTFLLLAATGLATRALARQRLDDTWATLAGCAALFSGYALFCAYERSAFAELAGGFWIPLLLLFILREGNAPGDADRRLVRRAFDRSTVPLALVVAGAWLSNAPVGVMASYLLAAVALALAVLSRSWAPMLRAAVSAVLGMGLAAIYLVPAAFEQRWVDIQQATNDPGEWIENNWIFATHADPAMRLHDLVLHKVSVISACMIAVALAGVSIAWLRSRAARNAEDAARRRGWWIPIALIPIGILFLQLPISLGVWNLLPKLRFLQFPWRWLVVLEAPMAIFLASSVSCSKLRRRVVVLGCCVAIFLGLTWFAGKDFFQNCDDEDAVAGMLDAYRSGAGFVGTDEYQPIGADDSLLATGLPMACLVADPSTVLGVGSGQDDSPPAWDASQSSCDATYGSTVGLRPENLHMAANTVHAGYLVLRLRTYPAWRVTVNGQPASKLPKREDGLMAVPVPEGAVRLSVDWTATPDVVIGRWVSLISGLLLLGLWWAERKLSRPHL
jgi:hypothetical protein